MSSTRETLVASDFLWKDTILQRDIYIGKQDGWLGNVFHKCGKISPKHGQINVTKNKHWCIGVQYGMEIQAIAVDHGSFTMHELPICPQNVMKA